MKRPLILLAALVSTAAQDAKAPPLPVPPVEHRAAVRYHMAFGMGVSSCAAWDLTAESRKAGIDWILGYWSGINFGAGIDPTADQMTGATTDQAGILTEVYNLCRASPTTALHTAVETVYRKLRSEGR